MVLYSMTAVLVDCNCLSLYEWGLYSMLEGGVDVGADQSCKPSAELGFPITLNRLMWGAIKSAYNPKKL